MLQVRKVMEHVYEKIINLDNESQTGASGNNDKPSEQQKEEEDVAVLAEEKIELLCQDQVLYKNPTPPPSSSDFADSYFVEERCTYYACDI